ncbi:TPM domain-containing protein [Blautia sp. HCP3S3_H10_1]|uniref:TPM domain-containing protein n=1 Tax=unclassified Blautia TaxID=2648079 RepID=UPI003F8E148F|nr:TPM domain-containing protein [Clostridia bacterium]
MKKQTFGIILAAALGVGSLFGAALPAAGNLPVFQPLAVQAANTNSFTGSNTSSESDFSFVLDEADLLSSDEESQLLDKLESVSADYDFDVAVATVQSINGMEMNKFTDVFFDENGYGTGDNHDGILFMVSIGDRQWHITTHGYGMTVFNQDGLDYLKEQVEPLLKDEDFYGAFDTYADQCQLFLEQAATGEPFDASTLPREPFSPIWIPISLGIGLLLAFLCTMGMRAQLKSVRAKDSAVDYVRQGSLDVTRSNDIFLYHTVTRTAKPKDDDNSSTGGSDSSHGGTGGSF